MYDRRRRMRTAGIGWALVLGALMFWACVGGGLPSLAEPSASETLSSAQRDLNRAEASLRAPQADAALSRLRDSVLADQAAADRVAGSLAAELAAVDLRLSQLGPAPAATSSETGLLREERRRLDQQRASLDSLVKQARLVSLSAAQADEQIADLRRAAFDAHIFQRSDSPLSPPFWAALAESWPGDWTRLRRFADQGDAAATRAPEPRGGLALALAIGAAAVLLSAVRTLLKRTGERREARLSAQALRRSGHGVWMTLVDTSVAGLAALCLYFGARWSGGLSAKLDELAQVAVAAAFWGGLVVGLGRALTGSQVPTRRLLPLSDRTALRVAPYPWIAAVITAAGWLLTRLNGLVGASLPATVATNCVLALAYALMAAALLITLGRERVESGQIEDSVAGSPVWTVIAVVLSLAILAVFGAVLGGYSVFAALVGGQIIWLGVLAALTFLLLRFIDDACNALFAPSARGTRALFAIFSLGSTTIAQVGVLLSASLRLLVLLSALRLALTPFGRGGEAMFSHLFSLGRAFHIGSITVSPSALAASFASLVFGVALVRGVQGWLNRRFLPVTDWDSGVRHSVVTAVGYLGVALAIIWALATAGLGLQRIALVASALSLGIGFGLQQIVQNFVSGLILLIERPIKVGDWVSIAGMEGDVRSIRVRATEIQTFDRTTLIVPNSELVTKTVQNKTLGDPGGRIQVQLAISRPQDAAAVRDLILEALGDTHEVLREPAPKVFIDSLAEGAVNFNCFAYVANPRDVYPVRSQVYFEVLERLAARGIPFAGGPTLVTLEPGAQLEALLTPLRGVDPALQRAGARAREDLQPAEREEDERRNTTPQRG